MMAVALVMTTPMRREQGHGGGQRDHLADDLVRCDEPEAGEVRHVERERGPVADHRRERGEEDREELGEGVKPAFGARGWRPRPLASMMAQIIRASAHHQHEGRSPVLDVAHQVPCPSRR